MVQINSLGSQELGNILELAAFAVHLDTRTKTSNQLLFVAHLATWQIDQDNTAISIFNTINKIQKKA
jgi:hypothetical protein